MLLEVFHAIRSKSGIPIDFQYQEDSEGDRNRGWTVDKITAVLYGKPVGYLKLSYIPHERFLAHYPSIFHFLSKIEGKSFGLRDEKLIADRPSEELRKILYYLSGYYGGWNESLPHDEKSLSVIAHQLEQKLLAGKDGKKFREFQSYHVDKPLVDFIRVNANAQRQGIALALYKAGAQWMKERGMKMWASGLQSDEAKAAWDWMDKQGLVAHEGKRRYFII